MAAPKVDTNLLRAQVNLLEANLRELRRGVDLALKYGTKPSSEVLYRMWQAEREDNIRLRLLMQQREREHEAFKERVESGLSLLYDRAGEIAARLSAMRIGVESREVVAEVLGMQTLTPEESRILQKFRQELKEGTDGHKLD